MSAASIALEAGFAALLASNGEDLEFRDGELVGIVSYPERREDLGFGVRYEAQRVSKIEFRDDDIPSGGSPAQGETITDDRGQFHKIENAEQRGSNWVCECTVSGP